MWHAFDIIADELTVPEALRSTRPGATRNLTYREQVVRWFSDKSGKGQWPAVVDQRPGMVIQRTHDADTVLNVEHTRLQSVPVTFKLNMACAENSTQSPRSWEATQVFGATDAPSNLDALSERGEWDGTHVNHQVKGKSGRVIEHTYKALKPGSTYALLASFPYESLKTNDVESHTFDALFTEAMQYVGHASFVKGAPGNADDHRLAKGLNCYRLIPQSGFPMEFWVNEHGVVIYLIEAATRAWTLQGVETMP